MLPQRIPAMILEILHYCINYKTRKLLLVVTFPDSPNECYFFPERDGKHHCVRYTPFTRKIAFIK